MSAQELGREARAGGGEVEAEVAEEAGADEKVVVSIYHSRARSSQPDTQKLYMGVDKICTIP